MDLLQLLVLALVQGITEFLPISSSAHLILVPEFTGWADQGMEVDVAVHLGTLLAVMLYFWHERRKQPAAPAGEGALAVDWALLLKVVVATLPVVAVGFLIKDYAAVALRNGTVIALTTIVFGVMLYLADRARGSRTLAQMSMRDAIIIGVAQAIALIPGVSRSGVTMTAALFLGYSRIDAAKFSLLLSIPTILGASVLIGHELYQTGQLAIPRDVWLAALLAFVAALLAIRAMMAWLRRASFTPFAVYRLVLGGGLLVWLYA